MAEELPQDDGLAPEPEPTDTPIDEPGEDTPPAPRDRISERFAKLTRALGDKDRAMAALQDQITQLRAERTSPPVEPVLPTDQRPKVDDFPDYDAYVEAVADWKAEQKWAQKAQESTQAHAQQTQAQQQREWQGKLAQAILKYPDWDDVLQGADIPVTPALRESLMGSEVGTDVLYYLASHEEEARQLSTLTPLQTARAIGRIEAQLDTRALPGTHDAQAPPRAAPPPVTPVARGAATTTRDPGQMSPQEYRAWRERQR